jgi:hypothetical protein
MNSPEFNEPDRQLLARLKKSAAKYGFTPEALVLAGETEAEFQRFALVPISGPFPHTVDKAAIDKESLSDWPAWVAELVPPGSKWERLHWPDGSITVRLINPGAQVLAATHLQSTKHSSRT